MTFEISSKSIILYFLINIFADSTIAHLISLMLLDSTPVTQVVLFFPLGFSMVLTNRNCNSHHAVFSAVCSNNSALQKHSEIYTDRPIIASVVTPIAVTPFLLPCSLSDALDQPIIFSIHNTAI